MKGFESNNFSWNEAMLGAHQEEQRESVISTAWSPQKTEFIFVQSEERERSSISRSH